MDEILKYLGTHLAQELAVITGAPIIFLITALVLGAVMYFAMGAYYAHSLSAKDSIIPILRTRLEHPLATPVAQTPPALVPTPPPISRPPVTVNLPTTTIREPPLERIAASVTPEYLWNFFTGQLDVQAKDKRLLTLANGRRGQEL
jgi:hypothetical protein